MSQQQSPDNVSIDEIPVDIDNTQSAEVDPTDVPDEIESIICGLAGEQLPTDPLVVLKAARWWYIHGKGGSDPAFDRQSSGRGTSQPTRPATLSGSTSSSSTSSRSASLTRPTTSGNRERFFMRP